MKLPWATWTKDQWSYFGIFGILLVIWPGIAWASGSPNVANIIYWVTGLVVLVYTIETHGMRLEMARQNEISVQPVVIILIETRRVRVAPVPAYGPQLIVRNVGRGTALFVHARDLALTDVAGDQVRFLAKFQPIDYLEPGKDAAVATQYVPLTDDVRLEHFDGLPSLDPTTAIETCQLAMEYQDTTGQVRETVMQMGKDGIRLLRHGKVAL